MVRCLWPRAPLPPSQCSSSQLSERISIYLHRVQPHQGYRTILNLPHSGLDVVEREVGHLVFETAKIHGCNRIREQWEGGCGRVWLVLVEDCYLLNTTLVLPRLGRV